ncbi:MAG: hypothetical protein ABDH32_06495 [Candidatus Caldarchaeales archaeon]
MSNHPKDFESSEKEELGFKIIKVDKDLVELERRTKETLIKVKIDSGARRSWKIDTNLHFLNHMIEMLAYYSELNIDLQVEPLKYNLTHTLIEDSGITLGRALYFMATERAKEYGINGFGHSQGALDEAFSEVRLFFEGRAGCWITRSSDARWFGQVEDIQEEFMTSFFEGFAQGMRATIHLDLKRASDPHHLWESAFRAFGDAIRQALARNDWRRGGIAGVKGTVD